MSRFKVTTYTEPEDSEIGEWYLIEAINSEDSNHDCLGSFEGIWGGVPDLIQYLEKVYQVKESDLVFVSEVKEEEMVPYSNYSGSRLISYEFGLVADYPVTLPYSVPYYLKLVFKKGDRTMTDIWCAKSQEFEYLSYLNRIVKKKEGDSQKCTYYFTDGSMIAIS